MATTDRASCSRRTLPFLRRQTWVSSWVKPTLSLPSKATRSDQSVRHFSCARKEALTCLQRRTTSSSSVSQRPWRSSKVSSFDKRETAFARSAFSSVSSCKASTRRFKSLAIRSLRPLSLTDLSTGSLPPLRRSRSTSYCPAWSTKSSSRLLSTISSSYCRARRRTLRSTRLISSQTPSLPSACLLALE